jgi:hypothetical protein
MFSNTSKHTLEIYKKIEEFFELDKLDLETFELGKANFSRVRFLAELSMFLARNGVTLRNGFRPKRYFLKSIRNLFKLVRNFLENHAIINKFPSKKSKLIDCIIVVLFQKLALFNNRKDVLEYLSDNKSVMDLLKISHVYSSSEHSKIKDMLKREYDVIFFDLIMYLRSLINIENITIQDIFRYIQKLNKITKSSLISFHKLKNYGQKKKNKSEEDKKKEQDNVNESESKHPTKYIGLMLIIYVMYALGIMNILESIGTSRNKGSTGYTVPQITMSLIAESLFSFESAATLNEEIRGDAVLRLFCSLKNGKAISQSVLNRNMEKYDLTG